MALHHIAEASARKWQVIGETAQAEGWGPTIRLCVIILVVQLPVDVLFLVYLFGR